MYMCSECGADSWSLKDGLCEACQPQKLSRRQSEVARLYKSGLDKHQIAERLCRSVHTIEVHLRLARQRGAFMDMPNKGDGRTMRHIASGGVSDAERDDNA